MRRPTVAKFIVLAVTLSCTADIAQAQKTEWVSVPMNCVGCVALDEMRVRTDQGLRPAQLDDFQQDGTTAGRLVTNGFNYNPPLAPAGDGSTHYLIAADAVYERVVLIADKFGIDLKAILAPPGQTWASLLVASGYCSGPFIRIPLYQLAGADSSAVDGRFMKETAYSIPMGFIAGTLTQESGAVVFREQLVLYGHGDRVPVCTGKLLPLNFLNDVLTTSMNEALVRLEKLTSSAALEKIVRDEVTKLLNSEEGRSLISGGQK